MTDYFRELDFLVNLNRMPEEYANSTALITCHDCEQRSTVPYHFIGHKCTNCNSYNTVILKTENMPSYPIAPQDGEGASHAEGEGEEDEEEDEGEEGAEENNQNGNSSTNTGNSSANEGQERTEQQ